MAKSTTQTRPRRRANSPGTEAFERLASSELLLSPPTRDPNGKIVPGSFGGPPFAHVDPVAAEIRPCLGGLPIVDQARSHGDRPETRVIAECGHPGLKQSNRVEARRRRRDPTVVVRRIEPACIRESTLGEPEGVVQSTPAHHLE